MAKNEDSKQAPKPNTQPIIIKRVVSSGHTAYHSGAWKVAYADFVTAMMAFFLLLWLLGAVPSDKLTGIAQYFEATVGVAGQKGIGFEGGRAQSEEGTSSYDKEQGVKYGVMRKGDIISMPMKGDKISTEEAENERFNLIEGELNKIITSDQELQQIKDSFSAVQTPEGLLLQISDQEKYPMFSPGSAKLQPLAKLILSKIAKLIKYSPNYLSIDGHTDADTSLDKSDYTNWELSTDRANAARRFLITEGIPTEQIGRIAGYADTKPIDISNPYTAKNRRISIILLRNSIMPFNKVSIPDQLIKDPAQNKFDESSKN